MSVSSCFCLIGAFLSISGDSHIHQEASVCIIEILSVNFQRMQTSHSHRLTHTKSNTGSSSPIHTQYQGRMKEKAEKRGIKKVFGCFSCCSCVPLHILAKIYEMVIQTFPSEKNQQAMSRRSQPTRRDL